MTHADFLRLFASPRDGVAFEERVLTDGRALPTEAARVLADEDYVPGPSYYVWLAKLVEDEKMTEEAVAAVAYETAQQAQVEHDHRNVGRG